MLFDDEKYIKHLCDLIFVSGQLYELDSENREKHSKDFENLKEEIAKELSVNESLR